MRKSRNLCLFTLTLFCLLGLVVWQTPQKVWTVMSNPAYSESALATVERFWRYVDQRQFDLAIQLVLEDRQTQDEELLEILEYAENNRLSFIEKIEVLENRDNSTLRIRVSWKSQGSGPIEQVYSFSMSDTTQGWKILEIKLLQDSTKFGELTNINSVLMASNDNVKII